MASAHIVYATHKVQEEIMSKHNSIDHDAYTINDMGC